jgi:hypothetical protein
MNTKARPAPAGQRGTEIAIPNPLRSANLSSGSLASAKQTDSNKGADYNICKSFEKARNAGKQNEHYAKTVIVLHERTSRYDPISSCLVDFKGRANVASVKNCQFVISSAVGRPPGEALGQKDKDEMQREDQEKVRCWCWCCALCCAIVF